MYVPVCIKTVLMNIEVYVFVASFTVYSCRHFNIYQNLLKSSSYIKVSRLYQVSQIKNLYKKMTAGWTRYRVISNSIWNSYEIFKYVCKVDRKTSSNAKWLLCIFILTWNKEIIRILDTFIRFFSSIIWPVYRPWLVEDTGTQILDFF